ncbi:hypothetical protein NBG4_460018 [Candidatus Sulfobium mesophilum]|uniref:FMN-binding domain-containing protein n=1 Tax=Candidatus Sulfobium mesophilum TaxID=2016548 RepID=A0A2U3QIK3_9BACT|nr:hypothetical protein NBG4_460018 [Candidatus Sulfobium mesophilum]
MDSRGLKEAIMKISRLTFIGFLISLFLASGAHTHDLVWPAEKLKALFPQAASFEQKNLYMSEEHRSSIEKALGSRLPEEDLKPSIYFAIIKTGSDSPPRKAAAIMFVDVAGGEGGKIEMGVAVSGNGELMKVILFENKETEKVTRPSLIKQFDGKKASEPFKVGTDISAPTGSEKSAQAIASGARRGLLIINEMFRMK